MASRGAPVTQWTSAWKPFITSWLKFFRVTRPLV